MGKFALALTAAATLAPADAMARAGAVPAAGGLAEFLAAAACVAVVGTLAALPLGLLVARLAVSPPAWTAPFRRVASGKGAGRA